MTYRTGTAARLVGGRLALDFANTADWADDGTLLKDRIAGEADLAAWADAAGLPEARGDGSLDELRAFRRAVREAVLRRVGDGLSVSLSEANGPVVPWLRRRSLRALVTLSALAVLADPRELARVKLCPGHGCGWLFLDETRNARRRWCQMEVCGNRAKAARHHARQGTA